MPNDANVSLRVDGLGQFQRELTAASNTVKSLGSASRLADSELRATGDTATYVQNKTAALTRQIEAQERAVQAAARGLAAATAAYSENSRQAQEWRAKLNNAQAGLNNLQADLNAVTNGTDRMQRGMKGAADETKNLAQIAASAKFQTLNTALNSVGNAAQEATSRIKAFAQTVWSTAKSSSSWADDLATNATKYGIDTQTLQQWQYAANFVDVEVSTLASSMNKLLSGMQSGKDAFKDLGVSTTTAGGSLRDTQSVFWDVIGALGRMSDETARDAMAQELFGKSFAELKPLIDAGRDSWEAYCDEAERAGLILSSDQVQALGSFNDSLNRMYSSFDSLVNGVMAELAPGFQEIADTAALVAQELIAWTKTEEGQETLHNFTEAIKDFVRALAGADGGENIVQRITTAITGLGDAAKVAGDHAKGLIDIIAGVGIGGGALWGVGKIVNIASGIKGLFTGGAAAAGGGTAAAATGGAAAGGGGAAITGGAVFPGTVSKATAIAAPSAWGSILTGAAGFTGGIAAVLGVGLLAKAMAGDPTARANLSGVTDNRRMSEQDQQREAERQARLAETTQEILAAVRETARQDSDWRTEEAPETARQISGEDIRAAIEGASVRMTPAEGAEPVKSEMTVEIELGGEAVTAVLGDGQISGHEVTILQEYLTEHFNPAVDKAVEQVEGGWRTIYAAMVNPPEEAMTPPTERTVLEFAWMTEWVRNHVDGDADEAERNARDLWNTVLAAVGSPEAAGADLKQSAKEAQESGTNKTWNAMTRWVMNTMNVDKGRAETLVALMWRELGIIANDDDPALDQTYTPGGEASDVFTRYVQSMYGEDYAEAKGQLDAWIQEISSPKLPSTTGDNGTDGQTAGTSGSTYMTGLVAELVTVRDEIGTIMASIAEMTAAGLTVETSPELAAALSTLDGLMGRAERLSGQIDWYSQEEQVAGRGAMGLAMAGVDWENSAPVAIAYAQRVREYELQGIDAEMERLRTEMGNAQMDWYEAVDQFGENSAEASAAKVAYDEAAAKVAEAEATYDERKAAVEEEFIDNLAEITSGGSTYDGSGRAKGEDFETPTPGRTPTTEEEAAMMRGLTGYANGSGWAAKGSGAGRGTEADANYWQNMSSLTDQQRQMAEMLRTTFTSVDDIAAFIEANGGENGAANAQLFRDVLAGNAGRADQQAWLQAVMTAAGFDVSKAGLYSSQYQFDNFSGQDAGFATLFAMMTGRDLSSYGFDARAGEASRVSADQAEYDALRRTVEAITGMEIDPNTVSTLDEMRTLFGEVSAEQANAESGYTGLRERVQAMVDAGVFEGVDWSTVDGGMVEEIINDMAQDAIDSGEQIPAGLGTGMLAGSGFAVDAARSLAQQVIAAMRDEMEISSPSKVMEGLGEFVGEGFALGITDTVGAVEDAVNNMADAVREPVLEGVGRVRGGDSYSASGSIYIDTYNQNSAEDIGYIRDQLADMTKRELQGFGHRR